MFIIIGLIIIAIGAFCQSSCYVPINKIKDWSWESYWIVQGVFAWLVFPILGALLAVPEGRHFYEMFASAPAFNLWIPEQKPLESLTSAVIIGVVVTLIGIAIIGIAGHMKAQSLSEEEKKAAVKDFNFPKGIVIALLAGFMSGCFNVGLEFGKDINFGEQTNPMFSTLPATLLVTLGGFVTNAVYCFYQNSKNKTWGDYGKTAIWGNNLLFCALAGLLWYSQFFGLSLGKGFLTESPTLTTFAFCILMALNVVFSNVWGIILKEWKGVSQKTIVVLLIGIVVLIVSTFVPELLK